MPNVTLLSLALLALLLTALLVLLGEWLINWLATGKIGNWLWQLLPKKQQLWVQQHLQKTLNEVSAKHWVLQRFSKAAAGLMIMLAPLPWLIKAALIVVLLIPEFRAWQYRRNYRRQLMRQWPATLDVIAMTLHAGLSFRATLHTLSEAATASIAFHELARMNAQQQAGFSLDEVLNEFANRIPHPGITLFRAAVLNAQKGGGALASTLEQQAQQARTMQLLAAEKSAQEAAVKLLLPLLMCFFPVTFLLILGPVILSFIQGETM